MGRPRINFGNCNNGCNKPAWTAGICKRCYSAKRYLAFHEAEKEARRLYNKKELAKIKERKRKRECTDLNYKIANRLRARLSHALKNSQKTGSAISDLGCSIEDLKKYLEEKFKPGMSWDNWSQDGWHIDHVQPLASFDLSDLEEFKKACHHTNLQPLWASENLSKGDKLAP